MIKAKENRLNLINTISKEKELISKKTKEALSGRMGDKWRKDLGNDGVDNDVIERRVSISHTRMMTAGALIIPSVTMEDMDEYPDPERQEAEWLMAVQSVAMAGQNILLAAHDMGLAACWMCAPLLVARRPIASCR